MTQLKHRIMGRLSSTVAGECLSLLASNAWRAIKRPVYPSSIQPNQFDRERERLWRHLHLLLPLAGYDLAESALSGCDVLVIGVGSTFGFALLLLSLGARRVVCIDPFIRNTDRRAEERFAEHLCESIPWPGAKKRAAAHLQRARSSDGGHGFLVDGRHLRFHQVALETAGGPLDHDAPFDLIISNAVLEHLKDVELGMRRLKRLLKPAGGMAHAFGFMNHTLFDGVHSQHYLTFSPLMWRLMTSNGSPPNRVSLSHFRRATAAAGLTGASFVVAERYGVADTEHALRHAHRSVVADNAEDMSALLVVLAMPRTS